MWSTKYKGLYIQGCFGKSDCDVLESPTGFGYTWKTTCRSLHAAKLAITRRLKESKK